MKHETINQFSESQLSSAAGEEGDDSAALCWRGEKKEAVEGLLPRHQPVGGANSGRPSWTLPLPDVRLLPQIP